jgi:hypothetical protein
VERLRKLFHRNEEILSKWSALAKLATPLNTGKWNVMPMGIFGKNGPKTPRGTINKMLTGDGRKDHHIQTSDEIYNQSGGIFGKKRRR